MTAKASTLARQTGNPVLILLDLQMLHFDRFEVRNKRRATPTLSDIVEFILSALKAKRP